MSVTKKKLESIPTIDVSLVVIRVGSETDGTEYAVDTASQIAVEVQTETTDAIKLVKSGKLLAQKPQTTTITGNQITLTDNVFSPTLAKICKVEQLLAKVIHLFIHRQPQEVAKKVVCLRLMHIPHNTMHLDRL